MKWRSIHSNEGKKRKKTLASTGWPYERRGNWKLKEAALDRTLWKSRFLRVYEPVVRHNARKEYIKINISSRIIWRYVGSEYTASFFLSLGTGWSSVDSFAPRPYWHWKKHRMCQLILWLCGPHRWSGRLEEEFLKPDGKGTTVLQLSSR